MRFRTLLPILGIAITAAGCGVIGNDDAGDAPSVTATTEPAPTTATATDEETETDGELLPIAAASAAEGPYFRAVEASAATLGAEVEALFRSPLGVETEEIADRLQADGSPTPDITSEEEATLREFFTTFWTDASRYAAELGDDLRAIDAPDSVRAQHDAYVVAVDAVVDSTPERIVDIRTRDATELLTILWEPDETIEAMQAACDALDAEAARRGIHVQTCP